jgi:hypothetical protein
MAPTIPDGSNTREPLLQGEKYLFLNSTVRLSRHSGSRVAPDREVVYAPISCGRFRTSSIS